MRFRRRPVGQRGQGLRREWRDHLRLAQQRGELVQRLPGVRRLWPSLLRQLVGVEPAKVGTRDRITRVAAAAASRELEKCARIRRTDEPFRDAPIVTRRGDVTVEHLPCRQHLEQPALARDVLGAHLAAPLEDRA